MFHWFLQWLGYDVSELQPRYFSCDSLRDFVLRVHEWRALQFGPVKGNALERRIISEMNELQSELMRVKPVIYSDSFSTYDDARERTRIAKEAADVIITICAWFGEHQLDLPNELDRVQSINEQRKWKSHGDGTGQHIKE